MPRHVCRGETRPSGLSSLVSRTIIPAYPFVVGKEVKLKLPFFWTSDEKKTIDFALCLDNEGYRSSLEIGKLYQTISDKEAEAHGLIRVIDESDEEYAFGSERFHLMELPPTIKKTLLQGLMPKLLRS